MTTPCKECGSETHDNEWFGDDIDGQSYQIECLQLQLSECNRKLAAMTERAEKAESVCEEVVSMNPDYADQGIYSLQDKARAALAAATTP